MSTETEKLELVILKSMPVLLLLCCTNTQSFIHDKSNSTLRLIKGKSRDLKKLLRSLG